VNSYRRLVPGFEAPVNLGYSRRNRSAAGRIPMYSEDPKTKRVESRCPDPACNLYLAFAARRMAGLDGIQRRLNPGDPIDKNLYDLPPEELTKVPLAPGSLEEALDALEEDHEFLLAGDVFTKDVVETQPRLTAPYSRPFSSLGHLCRGERIAICNGRAIVD
jgi:glutamine synthetase